MASIFLILAILKSQSSKSQQILFKGQFELKERAGGFILMCALVPMALIGYLLLVYLCIFGKNDRGRAGVRALDHFVNATIFNGNAWESISSNAWRKRDRLWARLITYITNKVQQDHCERANSREQILVDLFQKNRLSKRTVF